ncbi:MAG: hypothetical protein AAF487_11950 [Bacteroidota bacterium]
MLIVLIAAGYYKLYTLVAGIKAKNKTEWGIRGFFLFIASYLSINYCLREWDEFQNVNSPLFQLNSDVFMKSFIGANTLSLVLLVLLALVPKKTRIESDELLDEHLRSEKNKKRISFRK